MCGFVACSACVETPKVVAVGGFDISALRVDHALRGAWRHALADAAATPYGFESAFLELLLALYEHRFTLRNTLAAPSVEKRRQHVAQ